MIKVDWQRYIRNRMWFGYWYYYGQLELRTKKSWQRDHRYRWVPVILVRNTYENAGEYNGINHWYDTI